MDGLFSKSGHGGARENSGGARPGSGPKPRSPVIPSVPPDVPRWHCVRSKPGADLTADIEIRLAGFDLFAPTLWKPATPARRVGGCVRPARPDRVVSLFPTYLFVRFRRFSDHWARIRELPGVDYILGARPDTPSPMPDLVIETIRSLCSPNGCVYPPPPVDPDRTTPIPPGASVLLADGAMIGLTGICTWSDSKRVRLLLEILGRGVSVTVPRASVEAV